MRFGTRSSGINTDSVVDLDKLVDLTFPDCGTIRWFPALADGG